MAMLERFEDELADALRTAAPAIAAEGPAPRRPRRRARTRGWPALAVATAVTATTALVLWLQPPASRPGLASAATLLRQAAATAQAGAPADGYLYTRWSFRSTVGTSERRSGTQEQWIDARGRGERIVRGGGGPVSISRLTGDVALAGHQVAFAELSRAVRDPAGLRRFIDGQARHVVGLPERQSRAFVTYEVLEQLLVAGAPGSARAALLRMLATAPGLRRAGSDVTLTIGDIRFMLRLRGTTLVGTERRLLRRSAQAPGRPRVLDSWQLAQSRTVARLGDRR
jgi:hypothetical protein